VGIVETHGVDAEENIMNLLYLLGGLIAAGLFGYLVVALLFPEVFE
jgi:K+-transporting ATPase KdpF subunit